MSTRSSSRILRVARGSQLYGSDYGGTTLGPFKTVFTLTKVEKRETRPDVPYFMWWKYWGTSLVNKAFKEQIWGIKPNHLAVIETAYAGKRKGVRLIEQGREALKMVWNSARFPDIVEVPQHLAFRTVAPRPDDYGENEVEMDAVSLKLSEADVPVFPFDPEGGDVFDPQSEERNRQGPGGNRVRARGLAVHAELRGRGQVLGVKARVPPFAVSASHGARAAFPCSHSRRLTSGGTSGSATALPAMARAAAIPVVTAPSRHTRSIFERQ